MKTQTNYRESKSQFYSHSSNVLFYRGPKLPLSQQAQLASDALVMSHLLEIINDIEKKPEMVSEMDLSKIEDGIQIIEELQRGEDYLSQSRSSLKQRRESADTVKHIQKRTGLIIGENSEVVLATLNELKEWGKTQPKLDVDRLELTKNFLRDIHTGIMDRLESSDDFDLGT